MNHTLKRIILFIAGLGLGLTLLTGTASAAPEHRPDKGKSGEHAKNVKHADDSSDVVVEQGGNDVEAASAPDHSSKDQDCNGTHHSDTGNGANDPGPHAYSNTCDEDVASGNGVGDGEATGRPCAGCVGNADDKNPQGQAPDAKHDGNNGYECDRKGEEDGGNNGIAFGNPAHTGCLASEQPPVQEEPPVNENPNNPNTPSTPSNPQTPVVPASVIATVVAPPCGEGEMTVDVNGDGHVNGADCVAATAAVPAVLGVSFEVLGTPVQDNVAPAALARTGAPVEPSGLLMSALALIAFGTMLTATRRRPGIRNC